MQEVNALVNLLSAAATQTVSGEAHGLSSDALVIQANAKLVSLEDLKPAPDSIKAKPQFQSTESFIAYVLRFLETNTSIYLDLSEKPSFTAVLDHHGKDLPKWGRHQALFRPTFSLEWQAWKGLCELDGFRQKQLIAFIEDHFADIVKPDGTAVLQAVQKFEHVEKHTYDSMQNLDNGSVELTYIKGAAPAKVQFPHRLTIQVPVFDNEPSQQLDVRLRFEASEGSVKFRAAFVLDAERTERDALRAMGKRIRESLASATIYEGGR